MLLSSLYEHSLLKGRAGMLRIYMLHPTDIQYFTVYLRWAEQSTDQELMQNFNFKDANVTFKMNANLWLIRQMTLEINYGSQRVTGTCSKSITLSYSVTVATL